MRTARWRSVLFAGLAAASLAVVGAADARPSGDAAQTGPSRATSDDSTAVAARAAAARERYGIPPAKPEGGPVAPYDGSGIASAQASKLKTTITLPDTTFLSYLSLCTQVIQLGSDNPVDCPDFKPPTTDFDSFDNANFPIWLYASGPIWVKSPPGTRLSYGTFASVRVRTLAFGSIPVTATVHLNQPVGRNGLLRPLQLSYLSDSNTLPPEGGKVFPTRRWPGFTFPAFDGSRYAAVAFSAAGPVDIRVSDVRIDGRLLDVGSSCGTSRPGTIRLGSPPGPYDVNASAASLRGRPGGAQVLSNADAGSAQGSVSIPSFSGCGTGREDLDPLITNLVSGSNNPVDVDFTAAFFQCTNPERTRPPCPRYPKQAEALVSPAQVRKAAAVPAKVSAMWARLSAGERDRVVRAVARLPLTQRSAVLAGLPPQVATQVRAVKR